LTQGLVFRIPRHYSTVNREKYCEAMAAQKARKVTVDIASDIF